MTRLALAVVAVTLLLGGCGGNGNPAPAAAPVAESTTATAPIRMTTTVRRDLNGEACRDMEGWHAGEGNFADLHAEGELASAITTLESLLPPPPDAAGQFRMLDAITRIADICERYGVTLERPAPSA